jgi:hypothetical protein
MTPRVQFVSDTPSSPSLYSVASTSRPLQHLPTTSYSPNRSYIPNTSLSPPTILEPHHEITPLDHRIAEQGGTTSAIAGLPHRIQKTKGRIIDKDRIEELTRDLEAQVEGNNHLKRVNYEHNRFRKQVVMGFRAFKMLYMSSLLGSLY